MSQLFAGTSELSACLQNVVTDPKHLIHASKPSYGVSNLAKATKILSIFILFYILYFITSARLWCGSIECTNRLTFTFTILLFIKMLYIL